MVLVGKATQDPPRLKRKTCCSLPLEKTWNKNSSRKTQRFQWEKQPRSFRSLKKNVLCIAPGKDLGQTKVPEQLNGFCTKNNPRNAKA